MYFFKPDAQALDSGLAAEAKSPYVYAPVAPDPEMETLDSKYSSCANTSNCTCCMWILSSMYDPRTEQSPYALFL